MKTAIIKTDFWEDEKIYSLNSDTRLLYLCLVTNPKRNGTPAYKCSDRLLTAYTGYSKELISICKTQLQEAGLITFLEDYVIIHQSGYVKPTSGKLTMLLVKKEFAELPRKIQDFLLNHNLCDQTFSELLCDHKSSGAAQECISISKSIGISISNKSPLALEEKTPPKEDPLIPVVEFWNKYTIPPQDEFPEYRNTNATNRLLPQCRKITPEIKTSVAKLLKVGHDYKDFKIATRKYVVEVLNRDPGNDYSNHRFSFYDFFTQKNGYIKFINK